MAHVRNQVLHWLKQALTVPSGAPVTIRRATPYPESVKGALDVSVAGEQSQDLTVKGAQQRVLRVRVLASVRGDSEPSQDSLDALCLFVETRLAANPQLGGLARQYEYRGTEFASSGNGDQTMSVAVMSFDVTILTRRENPEAAA